jgi:hypothetical protein
MLSLSSLLERPLTTGKTLGPRSDPRFLGRLAGITQVAFAAMLGGLASAGGHQPEFVPRGVVLFVALGLPGAVGLLGTERRRPTLLVAAALTSFVGSFVAFSGVTLIFLVPSVLFAAGAVSLELGPPRGTGGLVAGLGRLAASLAIVVLLVGAGASALIITDSGCWTEVRTPLGSQIVPSPYSEEQTLGGDAIRAGCSTGLISPRGVGLAVALWSTALGLAHLSSQRRPAVRIEPATSA